MEVQEADVPPGIGEGCVPGLLAAELAGNHVEIFGGSQIELAAADAVLHVGDGGVAACSMVLQIVVMLGQLHTGGTDMIEEVRQIGIGHLDLGMGCLIFPQNLQVPDGGTAAMVADAVEEGQFFNVGLGGFVQEVQSLLELFRVAEIEAVGIQNPVGGDGGAVGSNPVKELVGHFLFMLAGAQEDIAVHAARFQNLGHVAVMTEAVHVVANLGGDTQSFLEVSLGVQGLTGISFAGGQVAVGLYMPAAHHGKPAFLNPLLQFFKHFRGEFLNPLIDGSGGTDKPEFGEFLHPVQSGTDGGLSLGAAFLPAPLPDRVQMGIANQIEMILFLHDGSTFL